MATSIDFINFIHDQLDTQCDITHKKMFGDYMIYCNGKPVLLVCDDTVYVKQIPETLAMYSHHNVTPDIGIPYNGARPHYVLDIENTDLATDMVNMLAIVLPAPRPKKTAAKQK